MPKSEAQSDVEKARRICMDPKTAAEWRAAWCRVCDRLEPFYKEKRPVMKVFEVHHSNETARAAFLASAVAGQSLKDCEEKAVRAVITP